MMYGHYLQRKGEHCGVFCIAKAKLERDYPSFMEEISKRWEGLSSKRSLKTSQHEIARKRQRALVCSENVDDEEIGSSQNEDNKPGSMRSPGMYSDSSGSARASISKSDTPYHFLAPAEKQRLREECQSAWDIAFVVCGVPFAVADHPLFREAIAKTRGIPDMRVACTKTMRTSRLVQLDQKANQFKDLRLKAGSRFGFAITSDGWRSIAKKNYHNYILVSVEGPIFVSMVETTGDGGTGEYIHKEFEKQFDKLGKDITGSIVLGITDTPSANRKAWRLLEASHPKQIWLGCGAHEISLLLKEWVKKIPDILQLFKEGHRIVKWINNHAELLKLFRSLVPGHFEDKRKHSLGLYTPGDTRMATVFKMLFRIKVLKDVLLELVSTPLYETASQKALKMWSDKQPPEARLLQVNGKYIDRVKSSLQTPDFFDRITVFINATKSSMYLLRLVDGHSPVLGKFYYCCALVDKHLRVLQETAAVPYIESMRSIYMKRWKRWHRPVHTLAYALDPCYQSHELTREELQDCLSVSACSACIPSPY